MEVQPRPRNLTVQWKHYKRYGAHLPGMALTDKLFESTGVIRWFVDHCIS
jgi:hypothetical protein